MDKFLIELIVAIREIKEILSLHTEEINKLRDEREVKEEAKGENVDERLVKLALQGSRNLYMQSIEGKVEKRMKELESAVRELSDKVGRDQRNVEVSEEHLERLKKSIAE